MLMVLFSMFSAIKTDFLLVDGPIVDVLCHQNWVSARWWSYPRCSVPSKPGFCSLMALFSLFSAIKSGFLFVDGTILTVQCHQNWISVRWWPYSRCSVPPKPGFCSLMVLFSLFSATKTGFLFVGGPILAVQCHQNWVSAR
ncbi:hypothetical protein ACQCT4_01790 [Metabacillus indicus]